MSTVQFQTNSHQNKILMVYIEPAPYIIDLINQLTAFWPGKIDVLFLCENLSQQWNMNVNKDWQILPQHKFKKFYILSKLIYKKKYGLIHLAGWGNFLFRWSIFFANLNRIPISIESDTPISMHQSLWKRLIKRLTYPFIFKKVQLFFTRW